MRRDVRRGLVFTPLVLMILGCGGDPGAVLYPVKGKLTKGGQPLGGVVVNFIPSESGLSSTGLTNASGEFVLTAQTGKAGAVSGKHKVQLSMPPATDSSTTSDEARREKMMKERSASLQGGASGAPGAAAGSNKSELFPSEYQDAATTPLQYEVKPGSNDFDIVIP